MRVLLILALPLIAVFACAVTPKDCEDASIWDALACIPVAK